MLGGRRLAVVVRLAALSLAIVVIYACDATPDTTTPRRTAATSTPTTTQELASIRADGYRLLRLPIVDFERAGEGADRGYALFVTARFNRVLPARGSAANFSILSSGLDARPDTYGRTSRHCYVGTLANDDPPDALREPQSGQVVPLTIDIVGIDRDIQLDVRLRASNQASERARRTLGCGHDR